VRTRRGLDRRGGRGGRRLPGGSRPALRPGGGPLVGAAVGTGRPGARGGRVDRRGVPRVGRLRALGTARRPGGLGAAMTSSGPLATRRGGTAPRRRGPPGASAP